MCLQGQMPQGCCIGSRMRDKKAIILIIRNLVSIIQKWLRRQWTVENGTNSCSQRGILVQRKDLNCGSRHLTRKLTWAQGFRTSLGNTVRGNDWSPHIRMASRLTWIYITFPDPPPQPLHSQIYELPSEEDDNVQAPPCSSTHTWLSLWEESYSGLEGYSQFLPSRSTMFALIDNLCCN